LTLLVNNRRWAFEQIHPQWTIALVTVRKASDDHSVSLRGPYSSYERYTHRNDVAAVFTGNEVIEWTDKAAIPLLPDERSIGAFVQMRQHPSLASDVGDWKFQPLRELHTTDNRDFFDFHLTAPAPSHTLPVWSGAAFDIWNPVSGPPYAFADPNVIFPFLLERRRISARRVDTPFVGLAARDLESTTSLSINAPRIAFRDVCRATDSRTMICALIPSRVALVHKAPYLLQQRGSKADEAYLLAVLSSIPFDWYARRFVEITMSYGLLNAFPVPRVNQHDGSMLDPGGEPLNQPGDFRSIRARLIEVSAQLAAVDERYVGWLGRVGVARTSPIDHSTRQSLIDEVNGLVALLYGLTQEHLVTLFETFHQGWDYVPRLEAALGFFSQWSATAGTGKAASR
jgi:hypothetical protein